MTKSKTHKQNERRSGRWLKRCVRPRVVGLKNGVEIRNDIMAIIESKPANLISNLAGYTIRIRNEAFLAGDDKSPAQAHELQKPLDSQSQRTLIILKANADILTARQIPNIVKVLAAIKRAGKNIADLKVFRVIKGKCDVSAIWIGGDKTADAGDSNYANFHKRVATRSNESSSPTAGAAVVERKEKHE